MSSEWQRRLAKSRTVKRKIIKDEGLTLAKLKEIRDELNAREQNQNPKPEKQNEILAPEFPTTQ